MTQNLLADKPGPNQEDAESLSDRTLVLAEAPHPSCVRSGTRTPIIHTGYAPEYADDCTITIELTADISADLTIEPDTTGVIPGVYAFAQAIPDTDPDTTAVLTDDTLSIPSHVSGSTFAPPVNTNGQTTSPSLNLGAVIALDLESIGHNRKSREIAACVAFGDIGFGSKSISDIRQYIIAAHRWTNGLNAFLHDNSTSVFYPAGVSSLQLIHRLATLHDKRIHPPRRFLSNAWGAHVKRRTQSIWRTAKAECDALEDRIRIHKRWIDIDSIPLNERTLAQVRQLTAAGRMAPGRRQATVWLNRYLNKKLRTGDSVVQQGLIALQSDLESILKFRQHVLYSRSLGPAFRGLDTHWNELHKIIGYSQSLHDVLNDPEVAARIVDHWDTQAEPLYRLSRKASAVSRRIRKLTRLVQRQYLIPDDPTAFLLAARALVDRFDIWMEALAGCNEKLTPRQILAGHGSTGDRPDQTINAPVALTGQS